uniref:CXXC-type domain-containing protein n=1 Tax=Oryzias sinensis TaxID=183150 RepID=A0A8C7YHF7_9TELE
MDLEQHDELCLGARVEVTETRREKNGTEEHWRKLFPNIKDCTVVIVRPPLEQLKHWGVAGRGKQKRTPNLRAGWDQTLAPKLHNRERRSASFVKRVRIQANLFLEDELERPHSRLRLAHCTGVTSDSTNFEDNDGNCQPKMDHSYCLQGDVQDTPDSSSQQQDTRLQICCEDRGRDGNTRLPRPHRGASLCPGDCLGFPPEEKKNIPSMVGGAQWVLRRSQLKKGSDEEDEDFKKRRQACGLCTACLRKDCGDCIYCRDMRKFGGPSTKRQKCVHRRCLVVHPKKDLKMEVTDSPKPREETATAATRTLPLHLSRWRRWRENVERKEFCSSVKKSGKMWGSKMIKLEHPRVGNKAMNEEEEQEEGTDKAQQVMKKQTETKGELSEDQSEAGMDEEEEEEGTEPMQLNLTLNGSHLSSALVLDSALSSLSGLSGLLHQGGQFLHLSTGLTFMPPAVTPAVVILEPKEEEDLVAVELYGRSSAAEGPMRERAVPREEELFLEGVSEKGKYFDMEVQLTNPNQETLTLSPPTPSDITTAKVANDVMGRGCDATTCDTTCDRPESLPVSWGSYNLVGGAVSPGDFGGCGLLHLLELLRRIVLPAHWVGVLADGPEVQLLQCSRLSAMTDTIVHIRPNLCFYITVQNLLLPDSHRVHQDYTHTVSHLSQLVSLLLDLESLTVCKSLKVQFPTSLQVPSFDCHLLVAPSCITCLPCLLEEDEEEEEEGNEEEDD